MLKHFIPLNWTENTEFIRMENNPTTETHHLKPGQ